MVRISALTAERIPEGESSKAIACSAVIPNLLKAAWYGAGSGLPAIQSSAKTTVWKASFIPKTYSINSAFSLGALVTNARFK